MITIPLWPRWARNIETVQIELPWTVHTKHTHGPSVWPWWKIFSVQPVRASIYAPSTGWNVWIYTRWHRAVLFGFYIGRGFSRTEPWPELPLYQIWELREKLKKSERSK